VAPNKEVSAKAMRLLQNLASEDGTMAADLKSSLDGATNLASQIEWSFDVPLSTKPGEKAQTMGKMMPTGKRKAW